MTARNRKPKHARIAVKSHFLARLPCGDGGINIHTVFPPDAGAYVGRFQSRCVAGGAHDVNTDIAQASTAGDGPIAYIGRIAGERAATADDARS
jgi:hypothetical protein